MRLKSVGIIASVALVVTVLAGCSAPQQHSASGPTGSSLPKPDKPITLHILDVSGDLSTNKPMIENFVKANPKLVGSVQFASGSATDVVGKLQAQEAANRVDIDVILTGPLALSQMAAQKQLVKILPDYASHVPNLNKILTPAARDFQTVAKGYGVVIQGAGWAGPIWAYSKKNVSNPPKSPQALLAWAKAHPGKFTYANPTTGSGPSNAFIDALPYMLGDKNPVDPTKGWSKTWEYLQELSKYVVSYPSSGTSATFTGLASGAYDLVPSEGGWDKLEHSSGVLNDNFGIYAFNNPILSSDGHFAVVPKGVPASHIGVDLALASWLLKPEQQAIGYGLSNVFPVQGVKLSMAPSSAQSAYAAYAGSSLFKRLATAKTTLPLNGDNVQAMYDKWNQLIGSQK